VLGNEACDLDSLVSALVLAYALSTSTAAFPLRAALAPGAAGEYVAQ
jgi:inorganic pyrophosphatase/exopolyphosphatase